VNTPASSGRTRSSSPLVIGITGLLLSGASARAQTVFSDSFDGVMPPALAPGVALLTGVQAYAGLGTAGNQFGGSFLRSPTGNVVTLTLPGLPAHSEISVGFLFAAIDSLDGTGNYPEGDFLKVTLDGVQIFRESFANALPSQVQSYLPPTGVQRARHVDLGFNGPGSYYTDSAYDLSLDSVFRHLAHTGASATFTFQIEGPGIQSLDDESWAMDNLRVTVDCAAPTIVGQPAPASACTDGNASFTVSATVANSSYRWQREVPPAGSNTWVDLADGPIPGSAAVATNTGSSTLTISHADASSPRFCCIVTNSCGSTCSAPATLTVQPGGYANCDHSTAAPLLNVADFSCFLQKYASGDPYANCDGSTAAPALNVADFSCFLQRYAAGCS
jgi:hypothetical protein